MLAAAIIAFIIRDISLKWLIVAMALQLVDFAALAFCETCLHEKVKWQFALCLISVTFAQIAHYMSRPWQRATVIIQLSTLLLYVEAWVRDMRNNKSAPGNVHTARPHQPDRPGRLSGVG